MLASFVARRPGLSISSALALLVDEDCAATPTLESCFARARLRDAQRDEEELTASLPRRSELLGG